MRLRFAISVLMLALVATTLSGSFASFSGSQTAVTSLTANSTFAPVNSMAASIPSSASIGSTATVTAGTWTNSVVAPTLTYQWQFCLGAVAGNCTNVSGSTGTTFSTNVATNTNLATFLTTVLSGHLLAAGDGIRVVETATNAYGNTSQASNIQVLS